jgi:uncharacterized iron-regulated membrane protein
VGAWLTFPVRRASTDAPAPRSWWVRWKPSWRVKTDASRYRLNFDVHRAGGLWFWGLLLIMAISSVYLNLGNQVFKPVVSTFSTVTPTVFDQRTAQPPDKPIEPVISWEHAIALGTAEALKRGWAPGPHGLFYDESHGVFGVGFGEDHGTGLGSPWLYFDGQDGRPLGGWVPGSGTPGDIFIQLQFPLHSGQIAGVPGRIVIAFVGIVTAMLSITGIVVWRRKQRARVLRRVRQTSISLSARANGAVTESEGLGAGGTLET